MHDVPVEVLGEDLPVFGLQEHGQTSKIFCNLSFGSNLKIFQAHYSLALISFKAYPRKILPSAAVSVLYIVVSLACFIYLIGFGLAYLVSAMMQKLERMFYFRNRSLEVKEIFRVEAKGDVLLHATVDRSLSLFWKHRQGVIFDARHMKDVMPTVLLTEVRCNINFKLLVLHIFLQVALDIYSNAIRRSHLFRTCPPHFLRHAVDMMEPVFMIPGEVIYHRNRFKSKMIYVVSGVIQVLSLQDSETPILSLSSGSCLGESTLVLDYPSSCTVLCQSYCELHILRRSKFVMLLKK